MSETPTYVAGPLRDATTELVKAANALEENSPEYDEEALDHMEEAASYLDQPASEAFGTNEDEPVRSFLPEDDKYEVLRDALDIMANYEDIQMDNLGRSIVLDKVQETADYLSDVEFEAKYPHMA